jgi:hypothetical protein
VRFYTTRHRHTCGIDLHARTLYICILDRDGQALDHRKLPATAAALLEALAPFRDDFVIGVECMFSWYWFADLCAEQDIPFVLGHALSGCDARPRALAAAGLLQRVRPSDAMQVGCGQGALQGARSRENAIPQARRCQATPLLGSAAGEAARRRSRQ